MWVGGEVNYAMKYNFEVLSRQYAVVALFVRHLAYARGLKAATKNLKDHGEFWGSTASAHLELAVVEWCKVFGSDGEKAALVPCDVRPSRAILLDNPTV